MVLLLIVLFAPPKRETSATANRCVRAQSSTFAWSMTQTVCRTSKWPVLGDFGGLKRKRDGVAAELAFVVSHSTWLNARAPRLTSVRGRVPVPELAGAACYRGRALRDCRRSR